MQLSASNIITIAAQSADAGIGFDPDVLAPLALRLRKAGLFLAVVRVDGAIAFADGGAAEFFTRFALPQLAAKAALTPDANGELKPIDVPGVVAAAWALRDRRQVRGAYVVAARADQFETDEDFQRACGQLQLDAQWITTEAKKLPGYSADALFAQAGLLPDAVQDQLKLGGLQHEVESLSSQLANTYEELSLVYQISGGMRVNRRATDFFRQACLDVLAVVEVRGVGFALAPSVSNGADPQLCGEVNLPQDKICRLGNELLADMTTRKAPLIIHDLSGPGAESFAWLAGSARQLVAVPLQRGDQVLGCLYALDKIDDVFDSNDSKLLNSIANESAIYLENASLFEDVHGLMMGLLHSLTSAVDAKDAYTCGHSERVALISRTLAEQMKLKDDEIERVYIAGLLHDVGKIGVPEAVLHKAGRLTPEEFEQIKRHPEIGAKILQDIKQLQEIIPGVLHHHERYDGKGYPHALAGEKIPLLGRIICLADCFDAMTSSRTYRKALPLEVAMNEIRRCAGTQFDPRLAEHFLRTSPEALREMLHKQESKARTFQELQEMFRSK